ncbi:DinB family protein [Nafulsella turpanensis]|uniref:DinB family protein n=1 Tax=Nafulsella turpanensis TaxID=1265690 RepID=UPI00034B3815|nr:DinB family protein [Nafulsella turpanensis]
MRPKQEEYAPFYAGYVEACKEESAIEALEQSFKEALPFLQSIPKEKADHRYAEGKWSVKELLQHMIDTERIMGYRALRFARNDQTELAGFDEDAYVSVLDLSNRKLSSLVAEFLELRNSTLSLFRGFSEEDLKRKGKASGQPASVRAIGFIIAGHQRHHFNILQERYLK